MPKRSDLRSILVIGAGPIIIGQACEFDYAGAQACLALREEGYRVILVNSNPATIMTDPGFADATYIEPLTFDFLSAIIEKERPDALLATMGGQTALNLAVELAERGVLEKYNVELIGARLEAIKKAENRSLFRKTMEEIGLDLPRSGVARTQEEAVEVASRIGFPIMIRPSFTLGGNGCGIAHSMDEFEELCSRAFAAATQQELLLDEALVGWKEYEMEVIRDQSDNCIVVCSIENIDPLGVHTGDSITVAPAFTLTDKEYQRMRDASFAVLRAIGVETGGSNVQFAIHPKSGRMVVIEMNPRVSRSSALASKATGFPIAKVAAKLAVGYTLDELRSDVTGSQVPASFEPVIDYVVVKIPRFQFEKFSGARDLLGPQMRSVGEVMGIGRTFSEALLKAMRSLDEPLQKRPFSLRLLAEPNSKRIWHLFTAFQEGMSVEDVHRATSIDSWFLEEIKELVEAAASASFSQEAVWDLKRRGFSDKQIGQFLGRSEEEVRLARTSWGIKPVFKRVDSCGAEFSTSTAYLYSTYEQECESAPTAKQKVMILGGGANRIGQGIEFDYCCVHAVQALQEMGFETIMVNCNPETVSTDYDCADRLYFSPLTVEDILPIIEIEKPIGILLQYGGQTPLNIAKELQQNGAQLLGLPAELIERCEDRHFFRKFLEEQGLCQPENAIIRAKEEPLPEMGYPAIVRPSFVLGGSGMSIVQNRQELQECVRNAFQTAPNHPVLLERYLANAIEIDIDAICDGERVVIPAIMEQVEAAGIHSGDSASYLPSLRIDKALQDLILQQTTTIALKLQIKGLFNVQFAVENGSLYVLEVNPRASRTLPFLSKALGVDIVKMATQAVMGRSLQQQGYDGKAMIARCFFVKEAVFPFSKFDPIELGPEMKSTGEAMGIGRTFKEAYLKSQVASGMMKMRFSDYSLFSLQELYGKSSVPMPLSVLNEQEFGERMGEGKKGIVFSDQKELKQAGVNEVAK